MNKQQIIERASHMFPEHGNIQEVRKLSSGYEISSTLGCFILNETCKNEPVSGQSVTIYRQNGHGNIQGVDIDSKPIFFKTESQLEKDRLEWLRQNEVNLAEKRKTFYAELTVPSSDFNTKMNKLPKVFRQRLARFFRLGDGFWQVANYELYTCMAAVKIAYACRSDVRTWSFLRSSSEEEKLSVLGEDILNYLSGHQLTFACALACSYRKKAKSVVRRPGAMQMLAGRKTYTG